MTEWTQVEIPSSSSSSSGMMNKDDGTSRRLMESVLRVSFAGFAGALVGLSHQKRQAGANIFQRSVRHHNRTTTTTSSSSNTGSSAAAATAAKHKQRQPPLAPPKLRSSQSQEENLPLKWAVSFGAFVSILETSRFWSLGTVVMNHMNDDDDDVANLDPQQQHADVDAAATIFDYTLGGAVAGLAGGLPTKRPPPTSSSTSQLQLPMSILKSSSRRSMFVWSGIGTGIVLGLVAGICQVGLDAAEDYLLKVQAQQEQEEQLLLLKQQQQAVQEEENEKKSS